MLFNQKIFFYRNKSVNAFTEKDYCSKEDY